MCGHRRVNTAILEAWQRRNGVFETKIEFEIHGKFHEHEHDEKGVDTTAWVELSDMLPAYACVDALSQAIGAHEEEVKEASDVQLALLEAAEDE